LSDSQEPCSTEMVRFIELMGEVCRGSTM